MFDILLSRFDLNVIIIFNLGTWLFFHYTKIEKYKRYITPLISIVLGTIYVLVYDQFLSSGEDDLVDIPNVVNSFFLSIFLYIIGLKDVFDWLEKKGSNTAIQKIEEALKSDETKQG